MAEQIGRLFTDEPLRWQMAQRGLVQAKNFSWQKTAAATLNLYRQK